MYMYIWYTYKMCMYIYIYIHMYIYSLKGAPWLLRYQGPLLPNPQTLCQAAPETNHVCVYIEYVFTYIYIYIYMYREREIRTFIYIYIYTYEIIYIYIYIHMISLHRHCLVRGTSACKGSIATERVCLLGYSAEGGAVGGGCSGLG